MEDDKISTLPDELLCHILSFLPTKLAVSTSVLSRRWKTLWRSVSTFDFSAESFHHFDGNEGSQSQLSLAVYSFMLSRDERQPIKTFRLKYRSVYPLYDPSNVDIWINTATQCGRVRHLELSLHQKSNLPSCVLTTTTLVVLKLCQLTVNDLSSVSLPSLKTLHLESVHFKDSGFVVELLSGCAILEDLQLKSLRFVNVQKSEEGELNSLSKLVTADISISDSYSVFYIPLKVLYNVEFLRGNLCSDSSNDIPIFHNLIHLELIFTIYKWNWLLQVIETCPKLQILLIDKGEMIPRWHGFPGSSDDENWAYPQLVPECISSHLRACSIRGYQGSEGELRFAAYILQNARALQTMKICSTSNSNIRRKVEMIRKLFLVPRSSVTCQVSFIK